MLLLFVCMREFLLPWVSWRNYFHFYKLFVIALISECGIWLQDGVPPNSWLHNWKIVNATKCQRMRMRNNEIENSCLSINNLNGKRNWVYWMRTETLQFRRVLWQTGETREWEENIESNTRSQWYFVFIAFSKIKSRATNMIYFVN